MSNRTEDLWVVETTDGEAFIGQIDLVAEPDNSVREVVVYSGFAGHPKTVDGACIALLKLAKHHPDVVTIARGRRT